MTRWVRGEAEIAELVRAGNLQQVTGSQADGTGLLTKARRIVDSAAKIIDSDADSAYVLAYGAARHAGTALLAHQGLRPTSKGGHYALDLALKAQFSPGFRVFSTMRRRRNELEYPEIADEAADYAEADTAVTDVRGLIDAALQPFIRTSAVVNPCVRPSTRYRTPLAGRTGSMPPGVTTRRRPLPLSLRCASPSGRRRASAGRPGRAGRSTGS